MCTCLCGKVTCRVIQRMETKSVLGTFIFFSSAACYSISTHVFRMTAAVRFLENIGNK